MRRTLLVVEDPRRLRAVQGEVRRMFRIVPSNTAEQGALRLDLDAVVREGARRTLLAASRADADDYFASTRTSETKPDTRLSFVMASPRRGG
jgi:hypothetical protein